MSALTIESHKNSNKHMNCVRDFRVSLCSLRLAAWQIGLAFFTRTCIGLNPSDGAALVGFQHSGRLLSSCIFVGSAPIQGLLAVMTRRRCAASGRPAADFSPCRLHQTFHGWAEEFFARLGELVAVKPLYFILASVVVTIACAGGLSILETVSLLCCCHVG